MAPHFKRQRWKPGDTHKTCSRCFESKPVAEFQKRRKDGEAVSAYCRHCNSAVVVEWTRKKPEKHRENGRAWRTANIDRSRELKRDQYQRDKARNPNRGIQRYKANAASLKEKRRTYYHENKDAERRKNREWRLKNPARNAHKSMMYEARKRQAMPSWADKAAIFAVYEKCADMNKNSAIKYQVDHIYPLCSPVMCGLHVHYNLQIIPAEENQRKSNKVAVWLDEIPIVHRGGNPVLHAEVRRNDWRGDVSCGSWC